MRKVTLRNRVGCLLHERRCAELILRLPRIAERLGLNWRDLRNRTEQIAVDNVTAGRVCKWEDTSALTVARCFPRVGARILHHVLQEWPVSFTPNVKSTSECPEVSFVVGVRGTARLPQFKATVASLLAQKDCVIEVIVVEQSCKREFAGIVPEGVRYVHTTPTSEQMPFNRSWALNVGVRKSKGRVVVLHDADFVVPARFAREVGDRISGDIESARLARLIFYLDQSSSQRVQDERSFRSVTEVESIVQNNRTPIALTREAYWKIGGHDESFYGWGGEDNEFIDRASMLRHSDGAFLPVFHLWHPQAANRSAGRNAESLMRLMRIDASRRIESLLERKCGQSVPAVLWDQSESP